MIEQAEIRKDPIYLLTVGYLLALFIVAAMSLCIHVVIGKVVDEQNNPAVSISARQAQISQKIVFYAIQYAEDKDPALKMQMHEAIQLMRRSHESLIKGDKALNLPLQLSENIERLYFSLPYNLDKKVKDFLQNAETFLETGSEKINKQNPEYIYLVKAVKGSLSTALDAATLEYEAESELRIGKLQSYQKMALFVIFATLLAEASLIFKPLVTRVHNYAERLKRMAMTDGLTGIDNSRCFMQKCMKELKRSRRHNQPLCVAILDLDYFKKINDKYGHLVGDEVLRVFAQIVHNSMRVEDEFARIGGEEFTILLPCTNLEGAKIIAERIRNIISSTPICYDAGKEIYITASIGVAEVDPRISDFDVAMNAADKALYQAKENGRNQVVYSNSYISENNNIVKLEQGKRG
ncbi:MAG: hypothetical protein CO093_00620 [Alphaproteobacteria bacterium CG_4_9_14_3_um_filter_47_13]|nr:MAG: hypothetical protein CO093_00620 [Alphaproteobacteria bacterium CG_4_9_14_3_um_filter_47_13]